MSSYICDSDLLADRQVSFACRLTERQKVTGALRVASALAYAHEQPIIHQDLHKGNMLRTCDESAWKLADFGNSGKVGEVVMKHATR